MALSALAAEFKAAHTHYQLNRSMITFGMWVPVILLALMAIGWQFHPTRQISIWFLQENNPVELLTAFCFFLASFIAIRFSLALMQQGEAAFVYGFYGFFGLVVFIVGMEEIAWGQWLFGFDTPEQWKEINRQGETTLHNIAGIQGHSEIMRLAFSIAGMVGVALGRWPIFKRIAAPVILLPWFVVIAVHASIDVYNDVNPIYGPFDYFIHRGSELIEWMISFSALLYIVLNVRRQKLTESH